MHLYALTLQPPGAVTTAVFGNFSAPRQQEVVVAKGRVIELLRPDETGKLHTVLSRDVFGIVRSLLAFRLYGGEKDFLVITSDSGCIAILEFLPERGDFVKVHLETFGKSGCRRVTPGQYLAADPKGRAIMVASIEKQKLVYVMNRTPTEKLTISSPLEAHKSHAIVFDICGLDVGFDNPKFAALEVDYSEADADPTGAAAAATAKQLVFYKLDLGLNNMTREWSRATHRDANALIPVPGADTEGPGGVLVCAGACAWCGRRVLRSATASPSTLLSISAAPHPSRELARV
jgi:splicing factor 3B subunit 3